MGLKYKTFTLQRLPANRHWFSLIKTIILIVGIIVSFVLDVAFLMIFFGAAHLIGVFWLLCTSESYNYKESTAFENVYNNSENPQI